MSRSKRQKNTGLFVIPKILKIMATSKYSKWLFSSKW